MKIVYSTWFSAVISGFLLISTATGVENPETNLLTGNGDAVVQGNQKEYRYFIEKMNARMGGKTSPEKLLNAGEYYRKNRSLYQGTMRERVNAMAGDCSKFLSLSESASGSRERNLSIIRRRSQENGCLSGRYLRNQQGQTIMKSGLSGQGLNPGFTGGTGNNSSAGAGFGGGNGGGR